MMIRYSVLIALSVLLCATGAGLALPVPAEVRLTPPASRPDMHDLVAIERRNLLIGVRLVAGIMSLGIYAVLELSLTGLSLGAILHRAAAAGGTPGFLAMLVLPHGIPELAGLLLLASLEFQATSLTWNTLRGRPVRIRARPLAAVIAVGFVLIVVAGVIEVYVTPRLVQR